MLKMKYVVMKNKIGKNNNSFIWNFLFLKTSLEIVCLKFNINFVKFNKIYGLMD